MSQLFEQVNTSVFDFETASLDREAGLISLGCFVFNRYSVEDTIKAIEKKEHSFYAVFDFTEQFFLGFHFNRETAEWWRKNNADEITEICKSKQITLRYGLAEFKKFLETSGVKHHYCRHTHSDYSWLESACKKLKIQSPIPYNRVYDISTSIFQATGAEKGYIKTGMDFVNHNALGDCHRDAVQLSMINDPNYKIPVDWIPS